jgi:hypothetical protein
MGMFVWNRRAALVAGVLTAFGSTPAWAVAADLQATATFTPSTIARLGSSEVTIRIVNETGAPISRPISPQALPPLPLGVELSGSINAGDCELPNELEPGSSCEMTATVIGYDPGSHDWSGIGNIEGYDLTLTSAAPLVVYIPPKELRATVSYSPQSIAPEGQSEATITITNTAGHAITRPLSTDDLPALPNGLTMVGSPNLFTCDFHGGVFTNMSTCVMLATVTSTTLGNHKWTGTGQTNSQTNTYISLSDTAGLGVYGTPAAVVVSSGDNQAIAVGTDLETLSVTVTDANGTAVPGASVTFTGPSSGAGVTQGFSSVSTDHSGQAGISLTANQIAGDYQVVATVDGIDTPATFNLSNLPGAPTGVSVTSGDGQVTTIGTAFANALVALVVDAFGNPIAGQTVTFTAPESGATGTFENGQNTATTDVDGHARSTTFTANAVVGSYTVVASLAGASSASFNLENEDRAMMAGAVTATVAANSTDNPITLNVSGGTASAVAVADAPGHGAASASGTAITYTPDAGYFGTDSFTYTASNAVGTSAPATVTVTVTAPPITIDSISPNVGIDTGGTTVIITGNNFNIVAVNNTVMFGGFSANVTAASATSLTVTTPPANAGENTVNVSVFDDSAGTSATVTDGYTYRKPPRITSQPVNRTVTAGGNTTFSVSASGGNTFEWQYNTGAGFAPVPNEGVYSGATTTTLTITGATLDMDGYVYRVVVTDTYGLTATSTAGMLTVNPQAPVANAVSATVAANSAANPITLDITGGAADTVAIGTQAAHGTATASGTTISYTPTAGYSGTDSFTYTATNTTDTSAAATVTVTVEAPTLALSPADGGLPAGTVATAYSQAVSASEGTAPYSYAVTAGSVPSGLTLDADAGLIAGTPAAPGNSSFTVTATDFYGATGSASYSVTVSAPLVDFVFTPSGGPLAEAMAGEDYTQPISASGGSDPLLYSLASGTLPQGMTLNISTGELTGPLAEDTDGDYSFTIEVRDRNGSTGTASFTLNVNPRAIAVTDKVVDVPAGTTPGDVYLNAGATGGPFTSADLTFVEPGNAGTATITRGQLAQADPDETPSGWYLQFDPNPAYSGQVRVGFRLTSALGASNAGTVTYNLSYSAPDVAQEIDSRVQGFVQRRQSMISSTIQIPGLLERRLMAGANSPVTTSISPSADGLMLGFASSLAQVKAARNSADGVTDDVASLFNVWVDGALLAHRTDESGGNWGSFAMVSLGADYLVSEKALLGMSLHYDRMADPTDEDAKLTGNGWLAGPYASFEIGKNLFWDTSLLYGGSSNDIDTLFWDGSFDTRRWLFDSSLKGQWQLDDITVLTPRLRAVYLSEKAGDYAVQNGIGDVIELDGFTQEQLRVSLGAEIARAYELQDGSILTPKLGVSGGFSGLDGSGAFGSISTGMSLRTVNDWSIDAGLLFNIEGKGEKTVGAKAGVSTRF